MSPPTHETVHEPPVGADASSSGAGRPLASSGPAASDHQAASTTQADPRGPGLAAIVLRILAILAGVEALESAVSTLYPHGEGIVSSILDVLVMAGLSAPLVYRFVALPLGRRFASESRLVRTHARQSMALHDSLERLSLSEDAQVVVANAPVGLAVLTTELCVVSANPALAEIFATTERRLIGQPLETVFPGVNPWRLAAEVLGSDQLSPMISVDIRERGSLRHFQVKLSRLRQHGALRLLLAVEDVTARVKMQEQVLAARARYWSILDAASDAIISVDEAQRIMVFNQQAEHIFGYSVDEAVGRPLTLLIPSEAHARHDRHVKSFIIEKAARRPMNQRPVLMGLRKNGEAFPVEVTISKLSVDGQWIFSAIIRDISERQRAEREVHESREALQDFLDNSSDLIQSVGPDGRFLYVNNAWVRTLGYPEEKAAALTIWDIIAPEEHAHCRSLFQRLTTEESVDRFETLFVAQGGRRVYVEGTAHVGTDRGQVLTRSILRDVTERKQAENRLREMAYHDTLTGLPNRVLFEERATQTLAVARRNGHAAALLYLDLDRFKDVNDTLGHAIGDLLLKTVSQRLVGSVRASNTVCRLGGDEFAVSLGQVTPEGAAIVARNLMQLIGQPMTLDGRTISIAPSIGIAMFPADGEDLAALLDNADTAMYRAKVEGGGFQFFEASMHANAVERFTREQALRRALDLGQLVLFYQPQMAVDGGRLVGVEALLRWRRDDGSVVAAGEVIPLAEEVGLIVPIGEWVLHAACAQARSWQVAGLPAVRIAVNVSSRQMMHADFAAVVERALAVSGLDPQWLELEFTESMFLEDAAVMTGVVARFAAIGVGLVIHNFGTGYSSPAWLKQWPIRKVKIAGEFIREVTTNGDAAAIVTAMFSMAHHVGVTVAAEGVERAEQLAWLRARGVEIIQGRLIVDALPADAVAPYLGEGWRFGGSKAA